MNQVARSGNMKLLQYLYEHDHSDQLLTILDAAASEGNVEMAKWLGNNHQLYGYVSPMQP